MLAFLKFSLLEDQRSDLSSGVPVGFLISGVDHAGDGMGVPEGKRALLFPLVKRFNVVGSLGNKRISLLEKGGWGGRKQGKTPPPPPFGWGGGNCWPVIS